MLTRLRGWARALKRELHALALAQGDPRTPWYARVVVVCVLAYALSPIDLIPDPIPILGYLDDLLLLPLGIALAIRLIPPPVLAECRSRADGAMTGGRSGRIAAAAIVATWLALAVAGVLLVWRSVW